MVVFVVFLWCFILLLSFMVCWLSPVIYLDFFLFILCISITSFWFVVTIWFIYDIFCIWQSILSLWSLMPESVVYFSPPHVLGIWCHISHPFILWIFWLIFTDVCIFAAFVLPASYTLTYGLSFPVRVPFNFCWGTFLVIINSFIFCLPERFFISRSLLNDSLAG